MNYGQTILDLVDDDQQQYDESARGYTPQSATQSDATQGVEVTTRDEFAQFESDYLRYAINVLLILPPSY